MRYVYAAVLTPIEGEGYGIHFPDLKGCAEEDTELYDALLLAQEALNDYLMFSEDMGQEIPPATPIKELKLEGAQFASLITADTDEWRVRNARGQA